MIDIQTDTLIPLSEVPLHVPPKKNGKRIHNCAAYRWEKRGLETITMAGLGKFTTIQALQNFFMVLSGQKPADHTRTPNKRRKAIEAAERNFAGSGRS